VETGVPGEKPLQAKLRADYFSLPLFLYLLCLKQQELKKEKKRRKKKKKFVFKKEIHYRNETKINYPQSE
jgi:hypothetical protein